MTAATDNIEPLARSICERRLRQSGRFDEATIAADVDKYWHVLAAQIEVGFIDEAGETVAHSLEVGLAAYAEWQERHGGR